MKILAFTDLHGSERALKKLKAKAKRAKVDVIVCSGDVTVFGNHLEHVLCKLNELGKPVIIVHGNHEFEDEFKTFCKKFKNLHYIHEKVELFEKVLFMGYGGGGFCMVDRRFETVAKRFKDKVKKQKKKSKKKATQEAKKKEKKPKNKISDISSVLKTVLITHAPPYGTDLDMIVDSHCGNKSIRNFIRYSKPSLAFCGHIHECEDVEDKIGKTKVINPGPYGKIIEI